MDFFRVKQVLQWVLILLLVGACSSEQKAVKSFKRGEYQSTINLLSGMKSDNPGRTNYLIAESYRLSNRLPLAEPFYEKAGGRTVDEDSVQLFYALSLKSNKKYDKAREVLNTLAKNTRNDQLKPRVEAELAGLSQMETIEATPNYYVIKNLEAINTSGSEYAPVYLNNELFFTSDRSNGKVYEATGTPFSDIYKVATRAANVDASTVTILKSDINTYNANDGCVTFSPDGRIMVFAKGNNGKRRGTEDVDMYMSRFFNGDWTEPQMIPGSLNSPKFWDSTPSFGPDGRTLYFASNRDGGYGGTDIYSARMDSRGRFSRITNLGPEINTTGDEMFPYVSEDGRMFFSSDGHPGFGGLDLFEVQRINGRTVIRNLGEPMNSASDDFGIFLYDVIRGFYTSNRENGKGGDDIYTFRNEDPNLKVVNYALQGVTYSPNKEGNLQILSSAKVSLYDASNVLLSDFVTGNDGKFFFKIYGNESYTLIGEADGYLTKRQTFTTIGKSIDPATLKELVTNVRFDTTLVLEKIEVNKVFPMENIYYEYARAEIRPDAAKELDKIVQILSDNPEIKIELSSHTDSVDTEAFNLDLSQRRAESAVNYIVSHGISPDRIVARGYGESRPIARNTNPDGTDNPEGRQRNRRTEFKILEINAVAKPFSGAEDEFEEDKYFRSGN